MAAAAIESSPAEETAGTDDDRTMTGPRPSQSDSPAAGHLSAAPAEVVREGVPPLDSPADATLMIPREEVEAALGIGLEARPSPASSAVAFRLYSARASTLRLEIFDSAGRCVRAWGSPEFQGERIFRWDFRDRDGRDLPSGRYFARLTAGERVLVRTVTRVR